MKRLLHLHIHPRHPNFHRAVIRLHDVLEIEGFGLVGLHAEHLLALGHEQLLAVVEEFQHVRLDCFRIG